MREPSMMKKDPANPESSMYVSLSKIPAPSNRSAAESMIDLELLDDNISYPKMLETMDKVHARRDNSSRYKCLDICCSAPSGRHCCGSTSRRSEFDKFGVGVVIYFRFVKYLMFFFFLFTLLSVPSIFFSIKASMNRENLSYDYKSLLFYTTIGALGEGVTTCGIGRLEDGRNTVDFECTEPNATLASFEHLEWGVSIESDSVTCKQYTVFSWEPIECKNSDLTAIQEEYKQCEGKKECALEVKDDYWDLSPENCGVSNPDKFYFRAICKGGSIAITDNLSVKREDIGLIISLFDAGMCILFLVFLITLPISEDKATRHVRGNKFSSSLFSVEVTNIPQGYPPDQLRGDLWDHFQRVINKSTSKDPKYIVDVVDVQYAKPDSILTLSFQRAKLAKKKKQLIRRFFKVNQEPENKLIKLKQIEEIASKKGKKAKKLYKKIEKVSKKKKQVKNKVRHQEANADEKIVSAFITFDRVEGKERALKMFASSPFERLLNAVCGCCYRNSHKRLHNKLITVREAPDPSTILWDNLNRSLFSRVLRRTLSWVITISLWVITFTVIVLIKDQQKTLSATVRPSADCTGFDITDKTEIVKDYQLGAASSGYLECYCRDNIVAKVKEVFIVDDQEKKLCGDWLFDKSLAVLLPLLIVFAIVFVNIAVQFIFRALARFEKYHYLGSELTSRVIKIFFAQFLNTGLLILVINARFTEETSISFFAGSFDDFSADWYYAVGATLLITMLINIFSFPVSQFLFLMLKKCIQCCDRAYEELYTGPIYNIDYRYSQVLTLLFICFLYGAGLPLLYLTTFIHLFLLYWIDKCFLLKINRKPTYYDERLAKIVRGTLYYILILHLAFSIWIYGNDNVFQDSSAISNSLNFRDITDSISNRFGDDDSHYIVLNTEERLFKDQTILLTVLLAIFVLWLILKFFLSHILSRVLGYFCKKAGLKRADKQVSQYSYYNLLTEEEKRKDATFVNEKLTSTKFPTLRLHLKKRLDNLRLPSSPQQDAKTVTFSDIFSYDIRHNPKYQQFLDVGSAVLAKPNADKRRPPAQV